jgi:hypothetical protein
VSPLYSSQPGGRSVVNVQDLGAKGDTKQVNDGAMTNASAVLTSATAAFTAADVGKQVQVARARSTAVELYTTIATVVNGTTATVAMAPGFSLTARTFVIDGLRTVTDGVTTVDSTTITSATAAFVAADVGKQIRINAAHSTALNTTIASFQSATQVTLTASATRTVSGAQVIWGTDDTTALINACVAARDFSPATVYVPAGWYMCAHSISGNGAPLLYDNTILEGDGWDSIIRTIGGNDNTGELIGINTWARGDTNPDNNVKGIVIRDLQLQGTTVEDGFYQFDMLLSMSAASDVTVERVKFYGWRGDAVYIASATQAPNIERHNQRIRVLNCLFDGRNRDNRQAISVIDGDDVRIEGNAIRNCTRADMPGPIDLEPDPGLDPANPTNTFPIIRAIRIKDNHFYFCGGNVGAINSYWWVSQARLTNPYEHIEISGNTFRKLVGNFVAIFFNQLQYVSDATARNEIEIHSNFFFDGRYAIALEGVRGIDVHHNWFTRAGNIAGVSLGYTTKCLDVSIRDNLFYQTGSSPSGGGYAIQFFHADRTEVDRNVFENIGQSVGGWGFIFELEDGGVLAQPTSITATPFTTGGTLGAATRSYRLTTYSDSGETLATTAVTAVTTGSTARVDLAWSPDRRAKGTKVYGRTGGSELLMATLGTEVSTWSDTGSVTPSGALPGSDTTATGWTSGITATNNKIVQGVSNLITATAQRLGNHKTASSELVFRDNLIPSQAQSITPFVDYTSNYKAKALVASTANITLPPGGTTLTIDGVALANGDRVLLKNQTTVADNGVYVVDGIGTSVVLTRGKDANTQSLLSGMIIAVDAGTVNSDSIWEMVTAQPITVGTTSLRYTRIHPLPSTMSRSNPWAVSGDTLQVIGETIDRYAGTSVLTLPTAATHTCFGGIVLPAGRTVTNINFHYTTAAATITIFYVALIRMSDRLVLATSANATGAWAAAPANKIVALSTPYTPDVDTPVYIGLAQAATTGAVVTASPVFPATTALQARAPILVGTTTTPTTTPITGTAAALTVTVGGIAYCWLT